MIGTLRRAVQIKRLETRKKKLVSQRDSMMADLEKGDSSTLFRHEYPNTPVLEDVILELDYVDEALAYHAAPSYQAGYGATPY
jgi:hypothetical protein